MFDIILLNRRNAINRNCLCVKTDINAGINIFKQTKLFTKNVASGGVEGLSSGKLSSA